MFKVGQKVVCVDDSPGKATGSKTLIDGNIYTILAFHPYYKDDPIVDDGSYRAWNKERFRPLELDYDFVEEVIKQVRPEKIEVSDHINDAVSYLSGPKK